MFPRTADVVMAYYNRNGGIALPWVLDDLWNNERYWGGADEHAVIIDHGNECHSIPRRAFYLGFVSPTTAKVGRWLTMCVQAWKIHLGSLADPLLEWMKCFDEASLHFVGSKYDPCLQLSSGCHLSGARLDPTLHGMKQDVCIPHFVTTSRLYKLLPSVPW